MAYFNELPNFEYISNFNDKTTNDDYIKVKNLFIRAKIRDDILNTTFAFESYYVKEGERPDQLAEKFYDDSELDWVILLTNNIIDIQSEWTLDGESFRKYLIDKYESDENLSNIHHYETVEIKDQFNRTVIDGGYNVDTGFSRTFGTTEESNVYNLPLYQSSNLKTSITINLNQFLTIYGRFGDINCKIKDINGQTSKLKVSTRNEDIIDVSITNTYNPWPSGWGGILTIYGRSSTTQVEIGDEVGDTDIIIPSFLYEFSGVEIEEELVTTFNFIPQE
jgi:hypothetical protein